MEPFDHLPASDDQSSSTAAQDFNDCPVILEITPTKESCFTIFSAKEEMEEKKTTGKLVYQCFFYSLLLKFCLILGCQWASPDFVF